MRPNRTIKVEQTDEVSYKLDGLVLLIEGTGRNRTAGNGFEWGMGSSL